MNLFDMLKAEKDIPVSDPMARLWGYLYQQKHGVSEISGVAPFSFTSRGEQLLDYHIYGNTVQDGTPTPENPVEVQGMGEYDAELNGYKIPVTVSNGTNALTTPVYIGSEPLHKIGDYADYIDFERGVVVRKIKKIIIHDDGKLELSTVQLNTQDIARMSIGITGHGKAKYFPSQSVGNTTPRICSHFMRGPYNSKDSEVIGSYSNHLLILTLFLSTIDATGETDTSIIREKIIEWFEEQYFAGTPVTAWYALATPEEEPLENLLPIQTIKGSDVLTVDTTVQPSNIWIKGKIKAIN